MIIHPTPIADLVVAESKAFAMNFFGRYFALFPKSITIPRVYRFKSF
jgi:hypothetical protein